MSKKYKIIHLAQTPLVGAPGKISRVLNQAGISSGSYCVTDYPNKGPLYKQFIDNTMVLSEMSSDLFDVFLKDLRTSNIVHIHNSLHPDYLKKILPFCADSKFIYQVHSPLREGPLFVDRSSELGFYFHKKLVVSQYQPRHYPKFQCVPNVVLDNPTFTAREQGQLLKVIFSPSHTRSGRWNAKMSPVLGGLLTDLSKSKKIELFMPTKPVSPKELMLARRYSDVSIDEIMTGAYHQISLEGLCAGNAVINRADFFSAAMLSNISRAPNQPPFLYADDTMILDVIYKLANSVDYTNEVKHNSYSYFKKHLSPLSLIERFIEVYDEIS